VQEKKVSERGDERGQEEFAKHEAALKKGTLENMPIHQQKLKKFGFVVE
jgi:hypothetical protein